MHNLSVLIAQESPELLQHTGTHREHSVPGVGGGMACIPPRIGQEDNQWFSEDLGLTATIYFADVDQWFIEGKSFKKCHEP